jgi:hypothetical protein
VQARLQFELSLREDDIEPSSDVYKVGRERAREGGREGGRKQK